MMVDQFMLPRRLAFRLTREDFAAFEHLPRELAGRDLAWLWALVFACGFLVGVLSDDLATAIPLPDRFAGFEHLMLACLGAALGYGANKVRLALLAKWRIARAKIPITETIIDADQRGVSIASEDKRDRIAWPRVARVIDSADHVFLCTAPREAIILPSRAFASGDEMHQFARLADELAELEDTQIGSESCDQK